MNCILSVQHRPMGKNLIPINLEEKPCMNLKERRLLATLSALTMSKTPNRFMMASLP